MHIQMWTFSNLPYFHSFIVLDEVLAAEWEWIQVCSSLPCWIEDQRIVLGQQQAGTAGRDLEAFSGSNFVSRLEAECSSFWTWKNALEEVGLGFQSIPQFPDTKTAQDLGAFFGFSLPLANFGDSTKLGHFWYGSRMSQCIAKDAYSGSCPFGGTPSCKHIRILSHLAVAFDVVADVSQAFNTRTYRSRSRRLLCMSWKSNPLVIEHLVYIFC